MLKIKIFMVASTIVGLSATTAFGQACVGYGVYDLEQIDTWGVGQKNFMPNIRTSLHYSDTFFRQTQSGITSGVILEINKDVSTGRVNLTVDSSCKWSDGTTITAADIKAGIENLYLPTSDFSFPGKNIFKNGEAVHLQEMPLEALGITVDGSDRLSFESDANSSYIQRVFSHPLYTPAPAKYIEEDPSFWIGPNAPTLSSGPYVVVEQKDLSLELEKNQYFCGFDVAFDEIKIVNGAKSADFVQYVAEGDNIISYLPSQAGDIAHGFSIEKIQENFDVLNNDTPGLWFILLNRNTGPFTDDRVLEAFRLSLEWSGAGGYLHMASQSGSAINSIVPREFLPEAPQMDFNQGTREERLSRARMLLEEAGYTNETPLIVRAIDADTRMIYRGMLSATEAMSTQALPIVFEKDTLPSGGEPGSFSDLVKNNRVTNYDLRIGRWVSAYPSAEYFLRYFASSHFAPKDNKAEIDELLSIISVSEDREEITKAELQLTKLIQDGGHVTPVLRPSTQIIANNNFVKQGNSVIEVVYDFMPTDPENCN